MPQARECAAYIATCAPKHVETQRLDALTSLGYLSLRQLGHLGQRVFESLLTTLFRQVAGCGSELLSILLEYTISHPYPIRVFAVNTKLCAPWCVWSAFHLTRKTQIGRIRVEHPECLKRMHMYTPGGFGIRAWKIATSLQTNVASSLARFLLPANKLAHYSRHAVHLLRTNKVTHKSAPYPFVSTCQQYSHLII